MYRHRALVCRKSGSRELFVGFYVSGLTTQGGREARRSGHERKIELMRHVEEEEQEAPRIDDRTIEGKWRREVVFCGDDGQMGICFLMMACCFNLRLLLTSCP